jgi:hypothetical protein
LTRIEVKELTVCVVVLLPGFHSSTSRSSSSVEVSVTIVDVDGRVSWEGGERERVRGNSVKRWRGSGEEGGRGGSLVVNAMSDE